jgi:prepilin-type N-terminal cleavage/methylation domain-containing protein
MRRIAGFTLVELLVALFITAIMFTIGYRALDQAFRSRKEVDEQSARLIAVQQALRTIEQDFELLQPRPVRNLIGDGYLPAIQSSANAGSMLGSTNSTFGDSSTTSSTNTSSSSSGGASSSTSTSSTITMTSPTLGNVSTLNGAALPLVSFTRGGWTNPAGLPRPELQRVSYSIENGALMRSYTPELDATLADVPIKRKLVDHVKSFSLRFMDAGHNWQTQWPVLTTVAAGQQDMTLRWRPVAVEVTIELEDWGILMRHIEVAG